MDEPASGLTVPPAPPATPAPSARALAPLAVPSPAPPADPPLPATPPAPGRHLDAAARQWRPAVVWYWLCLLMLIAGIAWPVIGMRETNARIAAFQRVPLPAGGRILLPHAGMYVISYETADTPLRAIPAFRVTARQVTRGLRVRLVPDPSGAVYAAGPRQGIVVLDMKVSGPGTVMLGAPGAPASPGGSGLAVGSRLPGFVPAVVPGIALLLGGIAGIVLVATLRSRSALMRIRYPSLVP